MKMIKKLVNIKCDIRYIKGFYEIRKNTGEWTPVKYVFNYNIFTTKNNLKKQAILNDVYLINRREVIDSKIKALEEIVFYGQGEEIFYKNIELHKLYKKEVK